MTGTCVIPNQQGAAAAAGNQKACGWHFLSKLNNLKVNFFNTFMSFTGPKNMHTYQHTPTHRNTHVHSDLI